MKTTLCAALALSLSVASAALAAEPAAPAKADAAPAAKGPSDREQIKALEDGFAAAFNAKDVDKIMAFYAKKGLYVFDALPPRAYVGWDAYKKDWEGLFKQGFPGQIKFTLSDLVIGTAGSMAYSHSIQTIEAPGDPIPKMVVRVTDVYRKSGGQWLIVHEHVSVPVDLATKKPDLLSKP